MKRQNQQFTKFISLLKFPGLQYSTHNLLEDDEFYSFKKKKK